MKKDYIGEMSEAMTNEQALQGFEQYCETCRKNSIAAGAELVCNCCKVKRAKEAIEKQIPLYVLDKQKTTIFKNEMIFCGKCKCKSNVTPLYKYCPLCGQKLDWSKEV